MRYRDVLLGLLSVSLLARPSRAGDEPKYEAPKLPKEQLGCIVGAIGIESVDGLVPKKSWVSGGWSRCLTPGEHRLVVRYTDCTGPGCGFGGKGWYTTYSGEAASLTVTVRKGREYMIVSNYFYDGGQFVMTTADMNRRNEAYNAFRDETSPPFDPAQNENIPALKGFEYELVDVTGVPPSPYYGGWEAMPHWGRSIDETLAELDKKVTKKPADPWAYMERARARQWLAKKDSDLVIADYTKAIELAPTLARAYCGRAIERWSKGDNDAALADLDKAVDLDPSFVKALHWRGIVWRDKGDAERAILEFTRTIEADPSAIWAYQLRGLLLAARGQHDKALADYGHTIDICPNFAPGLVARAELEAAKGEYDKAIEDYTAGAIVDVRSSSAYLGRCEAWLAKQDYAKAIADCSRVIKINPQSALAYRRRGLGRQRTKAIDDAIADYTEAIRLAPKWSFPLNDRAICWEDKNEIDRALADYAAALALVPNDVVVHENAASAAAKKVDRTLAAEHYLKAGDLRQSQKQMDQALADWSKAIELSPGSGEALQRRGEAYAQQGDVERAVADYGQAVKLRPAEARWAQRLAELRRQLPAAPSRAAAPRK